MFTSRGRGQVDLFRRSWQEESSRKGEGDWLRGRSRTRMKSKDETGWWSSWA